jgi:LysM repeat protein
METIKPRVSIYKVKSGDSLQRIAQDQYGNQMLWPEVAKANRLARPNVIFVGQPAATSGYSGGAADRGTGRACHACKRGKFAIG